MKLEKKIFHLILFITVAQGKRKSKKGPFIIRNGFSNNDLKKF